jgi:integrase
MSLYKRTDSPNWWVKIAVSGGKPVQRSSGTTDRKKAKAYEQSLKGEIWQQKKLGVKPRYSWKQAVVKYLDEATHKSSQDTDKFHLTWLRKYLDDVMLDEITRGMLNSIQQARKADGVSNATVNRCLQVVSRILRKARDEWEWIASAPKVPILPEPLERVKFLTFVESQRLLSELPEHLASMVAFTLETGLRMSNVTGLQWSRVNLELRQLWVPAPEAKARKGIFVPLNEKAIAVIRRHLFQHPTYVFTYKGEPILRPNQRAFRKAVKRAGIEDFHWHDLRHTWATWHVQSGTPLHVLQKLGGWASIDMVLRYAHFTDEHLAGYAGNVSKVELVSEGGVATKWLREHQ